MPTYIIRAGLAGPVKIGKADDVEARREALQTAHHETLHVLRVIDTHFDAERIFHERFAALRIRGEWFEFSDEMLTFVPDAPVAPETVMPTGTTWGELLAPWKDQEIAARIGCSAAIVKRWREGIGGPSFRFVFAMINDPVLWRLPLIAAGRADIAFAGSASVDPKVEATARPSYAVERVEKDEAAKQRGYGWPSESTRFTGDDVEGR